MLLAAALLMVTVGSAKTRVIAHRGYWTCAGSAQNSLASLQAAHRIGVYGSEFDVYITRDGQLVVHHDPEIDGVNIENANYLDIKDKTLQNGERLPLLKDYLSTGKQCTGTQLILEIKPHLNKEDEDRCVAAVVKMVNELGMTSQVEYISFSRNACQQLAEKAKGAQISYLKSDLSPEEARKMGCTGIDYKGRVFAVHPEWIAEAQKEGMTVNVWTIDDLDEIDRFIKAGVDFITTNKPVEALKLAR